MSSVAAVLAAADFPLPPRVLAEAAFNDAAYRAEMAGSLANSFSDAAGLSVDPFSWSISGGLSYEYEPASGTSGLPGVASLNASPSRRSDRVARNAAMAAIRSITEGAQRIALNESAFRVLAACLNAAESEGDAERAKRRQELVENTKSRPRGERDDAARYALDRADAILELETAVRAAEKTKETLNELLGGASVPFESVREFLGILSREAGSGTPQVSAARRNADKARAQAAMREAELSPISISGFLQTSIDFLNSTDSTVGVGARLSFSKVSAQARAASAAENARAQASVFRAESMAMAAERKEADLAADADSLERRLVAAGTAVDAAAALADLVSQRRALGVALDSELLAALETVAAREETRERTLFQLLRTRLELCRARGTLAESFARVRP